MVQCDNCFEVANDQLTCQCSLAGIIQNIAGGLSLLCFVGFIYFGVYLGNFTIAMIIMILLVVIGGIGGAAVNYRKKRRVNGIITSPLVIQYQGQYPQNGQSLVVQDPPPYQQQQAYQQYPPQYAQQPVNYQQNQNPPQNPYTCVPIQEQWKPSQQLNNDYSKIIEAPQPAQAPPN